MQHSPQDMQRSVLISQSGFGVVNECSRASSRDDQPENRDALGASSRRRLLGERGAAQDPIREMKVAEPVDVELLQAERLSRTFSFFIGASPPEASTNPATTTECRTEIYFCGWS
jgi:hypothetical protein